MKKCPKCGTLNKDEFAFCEECGSALGAVEASASPNGKKHSGKKPLWLWCALGALVLIIAVVAILVTDKPDTDKSDDIEAAADADESSPQSDDVPGDYGWRLIRTASTREHELNLEPAKEYKYKYDDHGNLITLNVHAYGSLLETNEYTYDRNGNRIKEEVYHGNGELFREMAFNYDESGKESGFTESVWEYKDEYRYKYNSNGNLNALEYISYTDNKEDYSLDLEVYYNNEGYHSDEYGRNSWEEYFEAHGKYDEIGNLQSLEFYSDGEDALFVDFQYDDRSRLIKELYRYEYDDSTAYYYQYDYDQNGNIILAERYSDYGLSESTEYIYDQHGNLVEEICTDEIHTTRTIYEYEWGPITKYTVADVPSALDDVWSYKYL